MREIYCDESQADMFGKPLLCLGAYLAPHDRWRTFSDEWRTEILGRFSIPHLHAVDLRRGLSSTSKHLDTASRRTLVRQACALIAQHVDAGFLTYLRPDDLNGLTIPTERSRWGGAYGISVELLLSAISEHLKSPERVNVYFEAGHANSEAALQKIRNFKFDTEPVEWPDLTDVTTANHDSTPEAQMRVSAMRIGSYGTVGKTDSPPTQAADLFVYLAATALRNDNDPVYSGCLDVLLAGKPHVLSPWGPAKLAELVQSIRSLEERWKADRQGLYEMRGLLHGLGFATHALPWGIVVDKGPRDETSLTVKEQVNSIRRKVAEGQ
jgi:hypothetical protein